MREVLHGRRPPTRYFIEYEDPAREGEPSFDTCLQRNAPNLGLARRLAKKIVDRHNTPP